jgi:methyl-accepting chemotaxis protein
MKSTLSPLRGSLSMALATAILSVGLSGAIDYWGLVRLDQAADVRHGDAALALAAEDMREDVLELRRYEKDIFMNVGADALVQQYTEKWDRALLRLRYDLARARSASSASQAMQLQQVTDWIAAYREAFARICDSISDGTIRTTQQANDAMGRFKSPVRSADLALDAISRDARGRIPTLAPAVTAHRIGLALSLVMLCTLGALFVGCLRSQPSAEPA